MDLVAESWPLRFLRSSSSLSGQNLEMGQPEMSPYLDEPSCMFRGQLQACGECISTSYGTEDILMCYMMLYKVR